LEVWNPNAADCLSGCQQVNILRRSRCGRKRRKAKQRTLSKEHIVPLSLNGYAIIPQASPGKGRREPAARRRGPERQGPLHLRRLGRISWPAGRCSRCSGGQRPFCRRSSSSVCAALDSLGGVDPSGLLVSTALASKNVPACASRGRGTFPLDGIGDGHTSACPGHLTLKHQQNPSAHHI
jgi:hypothetical protein